MIEPSSKTDQLIAALKAQEPQKIEISLDRFKELYRSLHRAGEVSRVDIVLNGDWAMAQFAQLSNQRIIVRPNNYYNEWHRRFHIHVHLEEKDFEFADAAASFYGELRYLTLFRFIVEEMKADGLPLLAILILTGLFLRLVAKDSSSIGILKSTNDVLIAVSTLFFSLYILMTVTQNLPRTDSPEALSLFKRGLMHRFMHVDTFVAWFALLALLIAVASRITTESGALLVQTFSVGLISVELWQIVLWMTSVALTLIAGSLIIVVRYYFARIKDLQETELTKRLLDITFEHQNDEGHD